MVNNEQQPIEPAILSIDTVPTVKNILESICLHTGMAMGVVAYVSDTEWRACSIRDTLGTGLKVGQCLKLHYTICSEVYDHHSPVLITDIDACTNVQWKEKMARRGFKSYISFPIFDPHGEFVGTLCTIDFKTVTVEEDKVRSLFSLLSQLITFHLESIERLGETERRLREERRYSKRRHTVLSVLGHDLKNPLSAVLTLSQSLVQRAPDERQRSTARLIYDAALRMNVVINNIMDFARGKLGGGVTLVKRPAYLNRVIHQAVSELSAGFPERTVLFDLCEDHPNGILCDEAKMGQVFSNLIGNAFRHGVGDEPIRVASYMNADRFFFFVENAGEKLSPVIMRNLFKPFVRREDRKTEGLGLGLYISKQIVDAHGGDIHVVCEDGTVKFCLSIPALAG